MRRESGSRRQSGGMCIVSAGAGGGGDLFVCFTIEHSDLYRVGCRHRLGALDPATFGGLGAKLKIGFLKYNTLLPNHCGEWSNRKKISPAAVSPPIYRGPPNLHLSHCQIGKLPPSARLYRAPLRLTTLLPKKVYYHNKCVTIAASVKT
jgi:hypothetical protein